MVHARYEVRVNGSLSERARSAFHAMDVTSIPTQTIVFGELAEPSDLGDLLAQCNAMGLEVLSLRQLPAKRQPPRAHAPLWMRPSAHLPRPRHQAQAIRLKSPLRERADHREEQDHELAGSTAEGRQP